MVDSTPLSGYVYFVFAPEVNRVKIGYSAKHPDARLIDLQVGCPVILKRLGFIRGDQEDERGLHQMFGRHRFHGEWFLYAEEVRDFVATYTRPWPDPYPWRRGPSVKVRPTRIHTPPLEGSRYWTMNPILPEEI